MFNFIFLPLVLSIRNDDLESSKACVRESSMRPKTCFIWRCQTSPVDAVLNKFCNGNVKMTTFETDSGILVRGLQAQKQYRSGDLIAEVTLDPAISAPFRLGNDPWYAELAARLLAVADGKLQHQEEITRYFAQDLFESLDGTICASSFPNGDHFHRTSSISVNSSPLLAPPRCRRRATAPNGLAMG